MSDQTPYIPTTNDVREDYAAWEYHNFRKEEFDRWLNQVKRDAAREALDSYIEYDVKHAQKWSTPTDVGHFRDTHYPEDVAP